MASTPTPARSRPDPAGANGQRRIATAVAPPGRRVRTPELAVGVLVTVVFALGAVLWHLRAVDSSPALAVTGAVERGATIGADDVRVVYVSSDDGVARLDESQIDQVVGRDALVDLAPGTLLTASVIADRPAVAPGEGVAGLALDPGAYPALGLSPGDQVNVVRSTDPAAVTASGSDGDESTGASEVVVARGATVLAVDELASDRRLVSILAPENEAEAVAAEAGSGALRLVQVSP
ncbi:MAG TPA: SAF domain-containing protein [Egicoccus sp.]|nr:SAF domain-containing protein [Egicoccus sp.]HSK22373.1 SAF domain-containing protein [Egicoccus sp.]